MLKKNIISIMLLFMILFSTYYIGKVYAVDKSIDRYITYYGDDINFHNFSPINNSITGIKDWINITWELWNDKEIGAGKIEQFTIKVNKFLIYYYGDVNTTYNSFHNVFIQDAYNIPTLINLNMSQLNITLNNTITHNTLLNFTFNVQYYKYYNNNGSLKFTNITTNYILYYKPFLFDFNKYWIWYAIGSIGLMGIGIYYYLQSAGKIGNTKYGINVITHEMYKD